MTDRNTNLHHFYTILAEVYGINDDSEPYTIRHDIDDDIAIITVQKLTPLGNKTEFNIVYYFDTNKVRITLYAKVFDEPLAENVFDYYTFMADRGCRITTLFDTIDYFAYCEKKMADMADKGVC